MMSVTAGPSCTSSGVGKGVGVGGDGTGVLVGTTWASVGSGRGVLNSTVGKLVGVAVADGEGPQLTIRARSNRSDTGNIRFMSLILLRRK